MINRYGQWVPDFPGQSMFQDPDYVRLFGQANTRVPQQQVQPQQLQQPMQPQQQVQPQIHNGGFVIAHNEMEARNWPVAPGNSVTFKDESAPYIYTKTMGYNQLDTPIFEKFRLVKEDEAPPVAQPKNENPVDLSVYALKSDLDNMREDIEYIKKSIKKTSTKPTKEEEEEK